ncbi:CBS domain-containing protein CBSX1, chloroplastic-like [Malania oleifera]|uniref:CBS domain-containing protein CBSX1, chloroplastic-like n=1 Tax=Malania oleifera TaxID=397392 RepID=UPI0025ADBDE0|nr:CBS domain-containing protein CBSX1, chloroplastic-like [Malania oleifera]
MNSNPLVDSRTIARFSIGTPVLLHHYHQFPCALSCDRRPASSFSRRRRLHLSECVTNPRRREALCATAVTATTNSAPTRNKTYTVGDFMTKKEDLQVVRTTTTVDEAWEALVEKKITGFPVINDDWKLVGVVSDYDLLALNSISGGGRAATSLFPDVNSSWKRFNEIQKLLDKTNGKVIGDLMTHAPLVVHESTSLEEAARLLLETKYHRLPVVDIEGKLVGIITRGNVVRAALQIKRAS